MRKNLGIALLACSAAMGCASKQGPDPHPQNDHYSVATELSRDMSVKDATADAVLANAVSAHAVGAFEEASESVEAAGERTKAIHEAAIAYGAQLGLKTRTDEIQRKLKKYESRLDHAVNFNPFIYQDVILSPAIAIMQNTEDGDSQRLTRTSVTYVITEEAKIVGAPPTFRDFLVRVEPAPKELHAVLKPRNQSEARAWEDGVRFGWQLGVDQANAVFRDGLHRMLMALDGRVNYRKLVANGMVAEAALKVTEYGVTFNGRAMNVGEEILEIQRPASYLPHDQWRSTWTKE